MNNFKKLYFIGIGGIGMSGLAIIAQKKGYIVSGSDISSNYITEKLKKYGIKIFKKHESKNITNDTDLVVISSAIKDDNPEILKALKLGIKVVKRAKFLSMICENSKTIAVAGTHGKTTTTGMITSIFEERNDDYTAVIGGVSKHIGSNVKFERGEYFIIEADESDGSFLYYSPLITTITNIDNDHLDFYKNIDNIKKTFVTFINKIPSYGRAIICGDDENIKSIIKYISSPYYTYGISSKNDWSIKNIKNEGNGISYEIYYRGKKEDKIKLNVFGVHNALNSVAAYAGTKYLGFDRKSVVNGLLKFKGMKRRLDLVSKVENVLFYDDYAHHPTEIQNTLNSLKSFHCGKKIIAIFQPHRYSRTAFLYKEFAKSFNAADEVHIMNIYPAGEKPIKGISSDIIVKELSKTVEKSFKFTNAFDFAKRIKENDIIIGLGAGDIYKTLNEIKLKYETIIK